MGRGEALSRLDRVFFFVGPPFPPCAPLETRCRRGEGRIRVLIPREKAPPPLDKCPRTICLQRNCSAPLFALVRQTRPCFLLGSALFLCGSYGDSVSFCRPRKCLSFLLLRTVIRVFRNSYSPNGLFVDCFVISLAMRYNRSAAYILINLGPFYPLILSIEHKDFRGVSGLRGN